MTSFIMNNYSSAFPPLQSIPWAFPPSNHQHNKKCNTMISKYPAYLKYTNYAQLVSEQYDQMMKEVDLRLPQFWNKHDKARYIDVGMNGYDLYYSGKTKKIVSWESSSRIYPFSA